MHQSIPKNALNIAKASSSSFPLRPLPLSLRRSFASQSPSSHFPPPLSHPNTPRPPRTAYGQPLPYTHPHLLAPGELTIGISAAEYEARRRKLMNGLEEGSVVVVAGGKIKYMSGNIFYKFRQASNFWYLTGWEEPDSVLILEKTSTSRGYKMTMFCRTKDSADELWHGPRSGQEGARDVFGADSAFDISQHTHQLKSILSKDSSSSSPIYVDLPDVPTTSHRMRHRPAPKSRSLFDFLVPNASTSTEFDDVAGILSGEKGGRAVRSASVEIDRLRLIKSEAELRVMRKAADISSAAHSKVMRLASPTSISGLTESSLVSTFEHHTSMAGSPRLAYVPVCASGPSALTIHYTQNSLPLHSGDMVLLDAGCEFGGYSSDITRTFPIDSSFTSPQRDLYSAILSVLKQSINLCTEENGISLDELHRRSCEFMREELRALGFDLRGGELERTLYPHFVGHPLGVDLHDTMSFSRDKKLRAGMVITVEPGISVPPHSSFPKAFHNMSVRIEDEVLVREDDFVVMSVDAPREVVDIEACCQGLLEEREEERKERGGRGREEARGVA